MNFDQSLDSAMEAENDYKVELQAYADREWEIVDEFIPQIAEAIENKEEKEVYPDEYGEGADWPTYCDDCDTWHLEYLYKGYSTDDGRLYVNYQTRDADGNDDYDAEEVAPTDDFKRFIDDRSESARQRAWGDYFEWVVEHGTDPLDYYMVATARHHDAIYGVRVVFGIGHARLTHWRRSNRGEWRPFGTAPESLKEYLSAHTKGDNSPWRSDEIKSRADLQGYLDADPDQTTLSGPKKVKIQTVLTVRMKEQTPYTDARIEKEIRRRATKDVKDARDAAKKLEKSGL